MPGVPTTTRVRCEVDGGGEDPRSVLLGDVHDRRRAGDVLQLVRLVDAEGCRGVAVAGVDDHERQVATIGRHPVTEREGRGVVGVDVNARQERARALCGHVGCRCDTEHQGCGGAEDQHSISFHDDSFVGRTTIGCRITVLLCLRSRPRRYKKALSRRRSTAGTGDRDRRPCRRRGRRVRRDRAHRS